MFKNSFVRCEDGSALIYLTQGKVCVVDDEDLLLILQYNWHAMKSAGTWYAASDKNGRKVYMHRLIMHIEPELIVHHKDEDGLNNRRSNLSVMTKGDHLKFHDKRRVY